MRGRSGRGRRSSSTRRGSSRSSTTTCRTRSSSRRAGRARRRPRAVADGRAHFRLEVEDTGIGIAPEDLEHAVRRVPAARCRRREEARGHRPRPRADASGSSRRRAARSASERTGRGQHVLRRAAARADSRIAPPPPPRLPGAYEARRSSSSSKTTRATAHCWSRRWSPPATRSMRPGPAHRRWPSARSAPSTPSRSTCCCPT